jgi:hypothetical protein
MIRLRRINLTQYQVIIEREGVDPERVDKLTRKRDKFPSEFLKEVLDLLPESVEFESYDHYNMIVNLKEPEFYVEPQSKREAV